MESCPVLYLHEVAFRQLPNLLSPTTIFEGYGVRDLITPFTSRESKFDEFVP